MIRSLILSTAVAVLSQGVAMAGPASQKSSLPDLKALKKMLDRFSPVELKVDTSSLSPGDRQALPKLIEASRILDQLYMKQAWSGNLELAAKLEKDSSPLGQARLSYFWLEKCPWSSLDGHTPFVPGAPERKPEGANFYPEDMTKAELETWLKGLPADDQEKVKGFFSVIRRDKEGKLTWVPYSKEWAEDLTRAAALLREAAGLTENGSLKRFLSARADALFSDDYYASDLAWMDLDAPLEITFGPYETYMDELFGYKAAFEAYVTLRDDKETAKLAAFGSHLQEIENNLPIPDEYKNPKLGSQAPIRVVQMILSSGDGAHGVRTAAFNLPNDERVVTQKGSKRVMLKNVQEAKFEKALVPISRRVLAKKAQTKVSFDPFFTHILAHELMHGLGPHQIEVAGRKTSPREELKDLYSALEEAKADVLGLFALQYLIDNAERLSLKSLVAAQPDAEERLYTTFLASTFRTLRFGLTEAHGKGMALQIGYLMDKKAIVARKDGTFEVDLARFKSGIRDLAHDLLIIEATGDYAGAKKMLDQLAIARPEVTKALARLADIPTDIVPNYPTADELTGKPTTARQ